MRASRIFLVVAILFWLLAFPAAAFAASANDRGDQTSSTPTEIIVKFRPDVAPVEMAQVHSQLGGQVKETIASIEVQVVSVPRGQVESTLKAYSANANVAYAEPDYLAEAVGTPDDAWFGNQWGMTTVQAPQAWDVTKGSSSVKIAILDTGVDLDHPDLATKIVSSINFSNSPTVDDVYGHGTHVAGIAAADTDNSIGVAGLGYSSSIMNVKVLGDDGCGSYSSVAQGIIWAADNGAQVINMSLGGSSASATLENAINYAWNKGVVVVAAAGNSGSSTPSYPAYYKNVIAVAATDSNDRLATWSEYGAWVDVAAPGVAIFSTLINGGYGCMSGTSMASPHVAGLAALVFTRVADTNGNNLLNHEVRTQIENTCDNIGVSGIGHGRINAFKAVSGSTTSVGAISGKVTDSGSGMPVSGATVTDTLTTTLTDDSGNYMFSNVPAGIYTVGASASGYNSSSQTASVVAGQTTVADFVLAEPAPPVIKAMWVDSIAFRTNGKNLRFDVRVIAESGAVAGVEVMATLTHSSGREWTFNGITDSSGTISFMLSKAQAGGYVATITGLTAGGYNWDTTRGVSSASLTKP